MSGLTDLIATTGQVGLFDYYLPFVLLFAMFYGLLEKSKVFGKNRGVNVVVSFVAAILIVTYTGFGIGIVTFLSGMFGSTLSVLLALLVGAMIFIVFVPIIDTYRGEDKIALKWPDWVRYVFLIFSILAALSIYASSGGTLIFPGFQLPKIDFGWFESVGIDAKDAVVVVIFLIFIWVIKIVSKEPEPKQPASQQKT